MDPLSIAASVAGLLAFTGTVISKGYTVVSGVAGMKHLATLLRETANLSGILAGVKARLSSSTGDPVKPGDLAAKIKACKQALGEMDSLLNRIDKTSTAGLLLKKASFDEEARVLLSILEGHKSFFTLCLQLDSSRTAAEMSGTLRDIQDGQRSLELQLQQKESSEMRRKIIEWLGPTTESVHGDVAFSRMPGSSAWLMRTAKFQEWMSGNASSFWLCGTQGSGKTFITSAVIDAVRDECESHGNAVLAYHYCRFSDISTVSPGRLVGGLICQIIHSTQTPIPASLSKLFKRYRARSNYPGVRETQTILEELLQAFSTAYIIIDGLDEIQDRKDLPKVLADLSSGLHGCTCKVFVSSRPEADLGLYFGRWEYIVKITTNDVSQDIEEYVAKEIGQLRLGQEEAGALTRELVQRADGMFLWAACQTNQLSRTRTMISLKMLQALPAGLAQTFRAQLERLDEGDLAMALQIVQIVMYARRELDLAELVEALAVTPAAQDLNQLKMHKLRDPADIFEICGCLIKQSPSHGRISLAHFSVYEFFAAATLEAGRPNEYALLKRESSLNLLEICTTYLSMDDFSTQSFSDSVSIALGPLGDEIVPQIFSDTPLLDYAARFWWCHLNDTDPDDFDRAWPLFHRLLLAQRNSLHSLVMVCRYLNDGHKYPVGAQAIHIAALHGLDRLVSALLDNDTHWRQSQTQDSRTALHIAVEQGQDEVLRIVLTQNQSPESWPVVDLQDNQGRTALHIAVELGNIEAVRLLLDAGASIKVQCRTGTTPIFVAVENRWDEVADLMSKRMRPDMWKETERTPLHAAAQAGSLAWATSLIKAQKDLVNVRDVIGWAAIHHAADNGHREIVDLLLKSGSDVLPRDKIGWTPLHAAIKGRHLDCASSILAHASPRLYEGIWEPREGHPGRLRSDDPPSPTSSSLSKYGRYGAYAQDTESGASSSGASQIRNANSNSSTAVVPVSPHSESPLYIAVSEFYSEGVALLLKKAFRIQHQEIAKCLRKSLNPPPKDTSIIELLIQNAHARGSDVLDFMHEWRHRMNDPTCEALARLLSPSIAHGKLLPLAIKSQDEGMCQFLLENWPADGATHLSGIVHKLLPFVHALPEQSPKGEAAIITAGKQKILELLLKHGARLSDLNAMGHSALHSCIYSGDYSMARWLLRFGNVDARGREGETALLVAVTRAGRSGTPPLTEFVDQLIASGADLHAVDAVGRGVCHKIATTRNLALLDHLLGLGARAHLPDNVGYTPIDIAITHCVQDACILRRLLTHVAATTEPSEQLELLNYSKATESLLVYAAKLQKAEALEALLDFDTEVFASLGADDREAADASRTAAFISALCNTIRDGFRPGFDLLLGKLEHVLLTNSSGTTRLLVCSAKARREDYLLAILNKGADINCRTQKEHKTAADFAYELGLTRALALLIQHGATPLRREYLTLSLDFDCAELAAALTQRGIEFQAGDLERVTQPGQAFGIPMTHLLLDHGARPQLHHLDLAVKQNDTRLLQRVLDAYPEEFDSLVSAVITARFSSRQTLFDILMKRVGPYLELQVASIEAPDGWGGNLLHSAVRSGRQDQVRWVLAKIGLGADVLEQTNAVQYTPLMAAMNLGRWECAEILIRCGAEIREANRWIAYRFPGRAPWDRGGIDMLVAKGPWGGL
ncbi:ankyrin repeat-containing domain protein [Podospora conica]|nr:ankyrin repeat-containing domain protein [Schizothecium conicum]